MNSCMVEACFGESICKRSKRCLLIHTQSNGFSTLSNAQHRSKIGRAMLCLPITKRSPEVYRVTDSASSSLTPIAKTAACLLVAKALSEVCASASKGP